MCRRRHLLEANVHIRLVQQGALRALVVGADQHLPPPLRVLGRGGVVEVHSAKAISPEITATRMDNEAMTGEFVEGRHRHRPAIDCRLVEEERGGRCRGLRIVEDRLPHVDSQLDLPQGHGQDLLIDEDLLIAFKDLCLVEIEDKVGLPRGRDRDQDPPIRGGFHPVPVVVDEGNHRLARHLLVVRGGGLLVRAEVAERWRKPTTHRARMPERR